MPAWNLPDDDDSRSSEQMGTRFIVAKCFSSAISPTFIARLIKGCRGVFSCRSHSENLSTSTL
jgi:hypothetical protein